MFKPELFYLFAAIRCRINNRRNKNLAIFPDPLANRGGAEVRTWQRSEPRRSSAGEAEKLTRKAVEKALEIEKLGQKVGGWRWARAEESRGHARQGRPDNR